MSKFSENLKMLRKRENLTQTELAQKIGVGRSAISMYETGDREPDFIVLEALADTFNVDMDFLTGRKTEKTPSEDGVEEDAIIRFLRSLPRDRLRGILLALEAPEDVLAALDQTEPHE